MNLGLPFSLTMSVIFDISSLYYEPVIISSIIIIIKIIMKIIIIYKVEIYILAGKLYIVGIYNYIHIYKSVKSTLSQLLCALRLINNLCSHNFFFQN